jgi:hypothetical protein
MTWVGMGAGDFIQLGRACCRVKNAVVTAAAAVAIMDGATHYPESQRKAAARVVVNGSPHLWATGAATLAAVGALSTSITAKAAALVIASAAAAARRTSIVA